MSLYHVKGLSFQTKNDDKSEILIDFENNPNKVDKLCKMNFSKKK